MKSLNLEPPLFADLPERQAPETFPSAMRKQRLGDRLIDVALIDDDPDHARRTVDAQGVAALAESLVAIGQLQPIVVRPSDDVGGRVVVVAGRCRVLAARQAGLATLRAIVLQTDRPLALQLAENLVRTALHPVEEALALCEALRLVESADALARAVGRSTSHISRCRRIARMDGAILAALRTKTCAFSVVLELADPALTDAQRMAVIANAGDRLTSGDVATAKSDRGHRPALTSTPQTLCRRLCKSLIMVVDEFRTAGADLDRMTVPEFLVLIQATAAKGAR